MARANTSWNLENFLDSLTVELDKARETLAIKAINKPLTYAVKDVNLEMQLFPTFDGKQIKFVTAEPGQKGASKIAIQLGSITDQQVQKTSKKPRSKGDVSLDLIDEIDDETKTTLRKIGVTSVEDLTEIQKKNVDIEQISKKKINYNKLASLLNKARRNENPPSVRNVKFNISRSGSSIVVDGDNLVLDKKYKPVAVFNGELTALEEAHREHLKVKIEPNNITENNELIIVSDPFTVYKMNLKQK
jgi:hypothetical protein